MSRSRHFRFGSKPALMPMSALRPRLGMSPVGQNRPKGRCPA
jgi:hypothetical protein